VTLRVLTPLRYLWAFFPGTLIGLICVPLALLGGGRCRSVRGCLEVQGGAVTWFLRNGLPWIGGGAAMTLGHVILGRDEICLDRSRDHEHVHVRQYERWGPAFLPAYLLVSGWMWLRGRHGYFDNPFEREAFAVADRCRPSK
jgi:hypothetical protein